MENKKFVLPNKWKIRVDLSDTELLNEVSKHYDNLPDYDFYLYSYKVNDHFGWELNPHVGGGSGGEGIEITKEQYFKYVVGEKKDKGSPVKVGAILTFTNTGGRISGIVKLDTPLAILSLSGEFLQEGDCNAKLIDKEGNLHTVRLSTVIKGKSRDTYESYFSVITNSTDTEVKLLKNFMSLRKKS